MLRRRAVLVLSVLSVLGVGYVLLFTPTLGVKSVEVDGTNRLETQEVLDTADVAHGRPMLRLDTDAVEQRIASLPHVDRVEVSRSWLSTVHIDVTERQAVAYFDAYDGIRLVDGSGVPFHRVESEPSKLPELRVDEVSTDDANTRAATTVLDQLDDHLADRVTAVAADTPGSVELRLRGGTTVRWGDTDQAERKSEVLGALLSRPGEYYDVSSPELPTVK